MLLAAYGLVCTVALVVVAIIADVTTRTLVPQSIPPSTPIPVVVTNPSDPLVLLTLIVTVIGVMVSSAAAYYAWRSIVWARKDFAISSEQARKADAERAYVEGQRAKKPLMMVLPDGGDHLDTAMSIIQFPGNSTSDAAFIVTNAGSEIATHVRVDFAIPRGMELTDTFASKEDLVYRRRGNYLTVVVNTDIPARDYSPLGRLTLRAALGDYHLRWRIQSAQGEWPPPEPGRVRPWGAIAVQVIPPPKPGMLRPLEPT